VDFEGAFEDAISTAVTVLPRLIALVIYGQGAHRL
jgi:hypothetical protein